MLAALLLALTLVEQPTWQPELTENGVRIVSAADEKELGKLDLGGPARAFVVEGDTLYVALERGGLAIVDVSNPRSPSLRRREAEGRRFARLLLEDGVILAIEERYEVIPFRIGERGDLQYSGLLQTSTTTAVAGVTEKPTTKTSTAPPMRGRVVQVSQGRAVFELPKGHSIKPGSRVRIFSRRMVEKPDLATGLSKQVPSDEVTGVLEVEQVEGDRAMAPLGRGDLARAGDAVEATEDALSERLLFPQLADFRTRVAFHVRPFLGLGTEGRPFGVLTDITAAYYFETIPARIEASMLPGGFALGGKDKHYPLGFALTGAFVTDFFEIGLGIGGLASNDGPCYNSDPLRPNVFTCEQRSGFTMNQTVRLGALDGLNVSWQSSVLAKKDEFVFGTGRGELNLPLTRRVSLFGGGSGGINGFAYGEGGVRTYFGGNGGRDTLIISASIGYGSVFDGPTNEDVGGPAVGFGMEWRL